MLELSDGRKVILNDQAPIALAKEVGVKLKPGLKGTMIYALKAAVSGKPEIKRLPSQEGQLRRYLPDGASAFLNAASEISYEFGDANPERRVVLSGEAYFEVAKNNAPPFKVSAGDQ